MEHDDIFECCTQLLTVAEYPNMTADDYRNSVIEYVRNNACSLQVSK